MTVSVNSGVKRLEEAFSSLLRRGTVQRLHDRAVTRAGYECDRAAYLVLRRIVADAPIRITDLARDVGVEPSTVSRHVKPLEKRGWVLRTADPDDARVSLLDATSEGARVVDAIDRQRRAFLAAVLDGWDSSDRENLVSLLERFAADIEIRDSELDDQG